MQTDSTPADARAQWTFNEDTRDIEFGNAPVFRVYEADDFPCLEDEERAPADKWYDAQAQTMVLVLNSMRHDAGDQAPIPDPTPSTDARSRGQAEEREALQSAPDKVVADVERFLARFGGFGGYAEYVTTGTTGWSRLRSTIWLSVLAAIRTGETL